MSPSAILLRAIEDKSDGHAQDVRERSSSAGVRKDDAPVTSTGWSLWGLFSGWGRGGNDSSDKSKDVNTHAPEKTSSLNDVRNATTRHIDDGYTHPDRVEIEFVDIFFPSSTALNHVEALLVEGAYPASITKVQNVLRSLGSFRRPGSAPSEKYQKVACRAYTMLAEAYFQSTLYGFSMSSRDKVEHLKLAAEHAGKAHRLYEGPGIATATAMLETVNLLLGNAKGVLLVGINRHSPDFFDNYHRAYKIKQTLDDMLKEDENDPCIVSMCVEMLKAADKALASLHPDTINSTVELAKEMIANLFALKSTIYDLRASRCVGTRAHLQLSEKATDALQTAIGLTDDIYVQEIMQWKGVKTHTHAPHTARAQRQPHCDVRTHTSDAHTYDTDVAGERGFTHTHARTHAHIHTHDVRHLPVAGGAHLAGAVIDVVKPTVSVKDIESILGVGSKGVLMEAECGPMACVRRNMMALRFAFSGKGGDADTVRYKYVDV